MSAVEYSGECPNCGTIGDSDVTYRLDKGEQCQCNNCGSTNVTHVRRVDNE